MGLNEKFFKSATEEVEPFFNTVLYTGDSASSRSITGVGFDSDLVWIKDRTAPGAGWITDTIRGGGKGIMAQSASQEVTSLPELMSAFVTDGFEVGYTGNNTTNFSSLLYVAWCFKAGGAAVTTTPSGGIASEVSANPPSGFSMVKFTSDSSAGLKIAHGLSSAPEMIMYKKLNGTQDWYVNTNQVNGNVGNRSEGVLNSNAALTNTGNAWSSMATSTLINSFTSTSGGDYIAYCFHSVAGVSKIGNYVGSGAVGNLQACGFRPSFVLIKLTDGTGAWWMSDDKRNPTNPVNEWLRADLQDARYILDGIDYEATGFSFNREYFNESGDKFLYYAIA